MVRWSGGRVSVMALFCTVLAPFWHCSGHRSWHRSCPSLAWPYGLEYSVYALVPPWCPRAFRAHPGAMHPGYTLAPVPRRQWQQHGRRSAPGQPAGRVGLTPGCTPGQTGPARHLALYAAPHNPADRYPRTRTLCHPEQGHNGNRVNKYPALVDPLRLRLTVSVIPCSGRPFEAHMANNDPFDANNDLLAPYPIYYS